MPVIAAAVIVGAATVGASAIASSGASKAAKTQAEAQQEAIAAQERAAEAERQERTAAIAKEEATRQEAIERKEKAVAEIKYPTYLEIPEAQKLKGTLEERLAGRGLVAPVTPLDISKTTAPFAEQRRAGLKQTEAAISATASARGLGRSTIPVSQIGEASQAAERDIEERVAQLQIENKKIEESNIERERQQITDALARFEALTGREATSQEQKAIFERGGEFDVAETIAGKAGEIGAAERASAEIYKQNQFAIAESIAKKGTTDAAYELKQAEIWASALTGITKSAADTSEDIIAAIEKKQQKDNLLLW